MSLAALLLCLPQSWNPGDEPKTLLWPLDDGQTPSKIFQSYGQAEITGSIRLHAGLDLVPGADRRVWSLESGTVVRVYLGPPGDRKRSGLVIASDTVPGRAFQYLHLDPDSIQLQVGDPIVVDQYLGLVRSEDDLTEYAEHLHLSRVAGGFADQSVDWGKVEKLSIRNPLALIDARWHQDTTPPEIVFDETKPLRRNEILGDPRCLAPFDVKAPDMLDVLAKVTERSATSESLAPYRLQLSVSTGDHRETFGLILDGPLPVASGVLYDKHCQLGAFVFTNGNPNRDTMDDLHAWCASSGSHELELTAWDPVGLESKETLTIVIP